jgi:HflK protein
LKRVEIGFRTVAGESSEPAAYEWNVQHRGGRIQRQPEEADVRTGDENLVDLNWVVQYRVADPLTALFRVGRLETGGTDKWDELMRCVAESGLRSELAGRTLDSVLAHQRRDVEQAVCKRIDRALREYDTGLAVECVCLGDVHPPLDVVGAFREVSGALEQKESMINEAEAFRVEVEAAARGEADENLRGAEAFERERTQRAAGEAKRFIAVAQAYQAAPKVTSLRLYLDTAENLLAGRRKIILDRAADGSRRRLFLGRQAWWNPPAVLPAEGPTTLNTGEYQQP